MENNKLIIVNQDVELEEKGEIKIVKGLTLLLNDPLQKTFDLIKDSNSKYTSDDEILKDMILTSMKKFIEMGKF